MSNQSSLHKSVDLDSHKIADAVKKIPPAGYCGYILVNNRLVPYSFLNKMEYYLDPMYFDYGDVLSPIEILGLVLEEFTNDERAVAAECFLILIDQGRVHINFPDEVVDENFKKRPTLEELQKDARKNASKLRVINP